MDVCLYEQMEEALGIYSREARVLYLNPAAERMIGRPRDEVLGQIFWELFPKSVDTPLQRAFHQVALTGQRQQFDAGYDDADGSHWFSHRIYASGDVIYVIAVDITDKCKAHETLELNTRILESMAEGVGLVDDAGVFLYTNPAWERMLGYERGELTETRLSQALLGHLRDQGRWAGELQYVRKDGAPLTTYARMTAMELRGRSHYICVQEDITERKRDEARRRQLAREVEAARAETESERRRLYQLFNDAPAGIALLRGPDHIYALSNPINTELIHDEQVLGKSVREVLLEAEEQGFIAVLDRVYSTGETFINKGGLGHFRQPDGTMKPEYLDIIVQPTRDASGQIDGTAVFIFKVTEQVLALQRLEVLAEQLHHGEERLRTLVEASSVILWSTDAGGRCVEDSASWRAYTGQTLEQWLSPWGWLEVVHPEDRDRAFRAWSDAFTHGSEYNIEFRLHRAGGDYRHVQSRAVLLRQPDGAPREWFGAITDIHQRKQGELQLRQSIQMRDEFLSVASHELRTPLTPLSLLLQGFLRAASTQPDTPFTQLVTRGAEAGRRQIQRLVRLVGDLLDVSRISEGRLQPRREEMDLVALAQEVVSRFELQATTAGCQLLLHAPGPVVGWWDRLRLEQVVVNLVDNALKYGPGRPVCIRVDRLEDKAVLHVTDEGMGIPPEHQSRIFERFERAVSERHYGGLGLGLFISQQIVRAHGGRIRVESTPGVRTTFTAELPLEP
ncbi:PAS domain-containing sensor histidine kinase [Cystobacter fuscus]|uniref:PAS domain-containing sensor histidine kinase n=1 Tax=Cystobacter fuscus TaxID=43 RepID=UPI0006884DC8|nr:PAS domain S-box protein [Cystobacter fuscus]